MTYFPQKALLCYLNRSMNCRNLIWVYDINLVIFSDFYKSRSTTYKNPLKYN